MPDSKSENSPHRQQVDDSVPVFDRGAPSQSGVLESPEDFAGAEAGQKPCFMREDNGWRQGEDMPVSLAALTEPDDAGKVYTQAEIAELYPNGYVAGAPSLHNPNGSSYRFPEARPKRICG